MRKLLLNPTPLFRKLRQLSLLLTLLLVPQLAGAADYLTIAGIQVTDANASNITGTGITAGTVTFDPSNNTLTLDNARVNGTVSTTLATLNVHLKGHSIFNVTTDGTNNFYLFNGATNLYYSAENFGDVLEGIGTTNDYTLEVAPYSCTENYDGSVVFWKNSITNINNKCYCKLSKPYLFVGDNEEVDKSNYNSDTRFSFDAANSSLTFSATPNLSNNNAFLVKSNIANLTVNITDNIIYGLDNNNTTTGKAFIYTGNDNSSTLTLNIAEGKTLKVQWSNTSTGYTYWINQGFSNTNISYDLSNMGSSDVYGEEVQASLLYSIIFSNVEKYGLTIAGIPVASVNKDNVFAGDPVNDGKVSFTPATATTPNILSLNGATINNSINSSLDNLTIQFQGDNTLGDNSGRIISSNTNATLTFKAGATNSSLNLDNTIGACGISGFASIGFEDAYPVYYQPFYYDTTTKELKNQYTILQGITISTTPSYMLWIGPDIQVTQSYLESNSSTIAFTHDATTNSGVLTLNGAVIEPSSGDYAIASGLTNLEIKLKGVNKLTQSIKHFPTASGTLTFSNGEDNGSPLLKLSATNPVVNGFSTISYGTGMVASAILTTATSATVSKGEYYDIIVGEVAVTSANSTNVTGTKISGSGTVSYDNSKGTLIFDNISISGYIESTKTSLIVNLIGNSTINASTEAPFKYSGETASTTPALSFSSSDTDAGSLTMTGAVTKSGTGSNCQLTIGSYSVSNLFDDGNGTNQTGDWLYDSSNSAHHIYWNKKFNLWVRGTQVTESNKSNILGTQGGTPSASFENNTLTLTSLYLGTDANHYSGNAIETGLDNLSIKINNVSSIYCDGYAFKGINGTEKITFLTEGPAGSELNLFGTQGFNNISEKIFQNNYGYVPTSSTTYQIKYLQAPTMSSSGNNVTLAKSDSACYQSCNIVYSIEYSDGTSTSGTYSAPFEMTKPGTLTAYLTPGEGYGNSGNAVGKLFGMSAETYAIAVNEEITPTVVPAIEGTDGITYSFTSSSSAGPIEIDDHKITGREISVNNVEATFTQSTPVQTYVLNSAAVLFTVKVGDNIGSKFVGTNEYATYYEASNNFTLPTGMEAYIVTGVSDNQVVLKSLSVLPKLTPLLLYKGTATNFTSVITDETDNNTSGNKLKYAEADYTTTGNEFVLFKDEFVKATGDISADKCYLDLSGVAPSRGMYGIGDGSTVIDATLMDHEGMNKEEWYDLQGRRIQKPTKPGLYIVNGKKVVINNK